MCSILRLHHMFCYSASHFNARPLIIYDAVIYCGVDLLNCNNLLMPTWLFISECATRLEHLHLQSSRCPHRSCLS